jgi:hypothetical protein
MDSDPSPPPSPDPSSPSQEDLRRAEEQRLRKQQAAAVARAFEQLASVKRRLDNSSGLDSLTQSGVLEGMSSELRYIDTSACPLEFREAVLDFIHACDGLKSAWSKARTGGGLGIVWDILNGDDKLTETSKATNESVKSIQHANDRIVETWQVVEQVAEKYRLFY